MFSSTRPASQSYHVGTLCGDPSGRRVATTAGFACARNWSTSGGTGTGGTSGGYATQTIALAGSAGRTFRVIAHETRVRLPERHRALVDVDCSFALVADVAAGGLAELGLGEWPVHAGDPLAESCAQLVEVPVGIVGDAEVDQR